MAKIVKIENDLVFVGEIDGSISKYKRENFNFIPIVGDEIEVFKSDDSVIINKTTANNNGGNTASNGEVIINNQIGSTGPVKESNKVNKVIYCILAFFLGGIGIHKFYANKSGQGVLYLVFCWTTIPGIIAFIEFIVALCKTSDAEGNIYV